MNITSRLKLSRQTSSIRGIRFRGNVLRILKYRKRTTIKINTHSPNMYSQSIRNAVCFLIKVKLCAALQSYRNPLYSSSVVGWMESYSDCKPDTLDRQSWIDAVKRKRKKKDWITLICLSGLTIYFHLPCWITPAEKKSDWRQSDRRCTVAGVNLKIKTWRITK